MMLFADNSRGRPFSKDPAVVACAGRYLMYYTLPPYGDGRAGDGHGIGMASSEDLDAWTPIGEVPPLSPCDANGLCAPGAMVLDGVVHLFYQTYGNGRNDAICHATSTDGVAFSPNPTNPVFRPAGDWTCGRAIDADVIVHDGRLLLCWATRDPEMRIQMVGVATAALDSGFGRGAWRQEADGPVLRPELAWEGECIEAPALCRHGGRLFMFYGGAYNCRPQQIGCAVSDDGIAWRRVSDEPVLPNGGPGDWNCCESGHPFVFQDADGRDHLFHQGSADMGETWRLSRRTIVWQGDMPTFPGVRSPRRQ